MLSIAEPGPTMSSVSARSSDRVNSSSGADHAIGVGEREAEARFVEVPAPELLAVLTHAAIVPGTHDRLAELRALGGLKRSQCNRISHLLRPFGIQRRIDDHVVEPDKPSTRPTASTSAGPVSNSPRSAISAPSTAVLSHQTAHPGDSKSSHVPMTSMISLRHARCRNATSGEAARWVGVL